MKKVCTLLIALSAVGSVQAFTFSDGTFAVGDYLHKGFFQHTSTSAQQSLVGGNPGATMLQSIQHDGSGNIGFGRVGAFNQIQTYNPSVQGALSSVSFSADYYLDTSSALPGQQMWFAILQDGKTYYTWDSHSYSPHQWLGSSATVPANSGMTILNWTDGGVSFGSPDLSATGSEMKFGFITAYNLTGGASLTQRVDNFSVEAAPVPEPASLAILSFGAVAMAAKRRKRRQAA